MTFEEEKVLAFVRSWVISVTALEVLLVLKSGRMASANDLVRQLRSSTPAISNSLKSLEVAGLVMCDADGTFRYEPASSELRSIVDHLESLYAAKPLSVIRAIVDTSEEKLRIFARAFRLKD